MRIHFAPTNKVATSLYNFVDHCRLIGIPFVVLNVISLLFGLLFEAPFQKLLGPLIWIAWLFSALSVLSLICYVGCIWLDEQNRRAFIEGKAYRKYQHMPWAVLGFSLLSLTFVFSSAYTLQAAHQAVISLWIINAIMYIVGIVTGFLSLLIIMFD